MKSIVGFSLLVGLLLAYNGYASKRLRAQAVEIASAQPFCVQVAGDREYRPIRETSDTLPVLMRGSGGYHHAVLIVGDSKAPRTFHWSYRKNRFVEGTYGPFPIVCQPVRDYFNRPHPEREDGATTFVLLGRRISIPQEYRGNALWPGSVVGYSFRASAPHFRASQKRSDQVMIAFKGEPGPEQMARALMVPIPADKSAELDGLTRVPGTYRYVGFDDTGRVVSYVECMDNPSIDCLHIFSHEGLTYSFHHPHSLLPRWRAMHARLVALHARFELD